MRGLLFLLSLTACNSADPREPYRFSAIIDRESSTVLLDGSSTLEPIRATYPTFEDAAAAIHVPVTITSSAGASNISQVP